jgi:hypothetical protein
LCFIFRSQFRFLPDKPILGKIFGVFVKSPFELQSSLSAAQFMRRFEKANLALEYFSTGVLLAGGAPQYLDRRYPQRPGTFSVEKGCRSVCHRPRSECGTATGKSPHRSSVFTFTGWYQMRERFGGVFLDGEPKGGKRSDEAIWRSLNHRFDFGGYGILSVRQGEPRCPKHRPHHLIENSLRRLSPRMFGAIKSGAITSER